MKRRILNVLNAPFPYFLNDEKKNLLLSIGISVFLVAFLMTFNPAAQHQLPKTVLIAVFTFITLFPCIVITPRLLPGVFDTENWTFGKHLVFSTVMLIIIGAVITTGLYVLNYYPQFTFAETLRHIYPNVFTYGVVPTTIVTLLLKNQMLKDNLRDAILANRELGKIQVLKEQTPEQRSTNLVTVYSDTSENLSLNMPDLLFVEASDNYSTFFWKNGASVEKKMLRMNLKSVESQLNNSFTIRCHRSFIVNIYAIGTIDGNTNGYKLSLGNDYSIPVSRSKGKEVMEKIEQIRSVMELR
jgi:hypothetical protein